MLGKIDVLKGKFLVLFIGMKLINIEVSYDCIWLDLIVIRIYILYVKYWNIFICVVLRYFVVMLRFVIEKYM